MLELETLASVSTQIRLELDMSNIPDFNSIFNKEEINHAGSGRMFLSISATARLVKIANQSLGDALGIYTGSSRINSKLSASLDAVGFELPVRKEWSKTGIPDIAVAVIVNHYARYARVIHEEVVALADLLAAYSVRSLLQKAYGYSEIEPSKPTTPSSGITLSSEDVAELVQAVNELKEIRRTGNSQPGLNGYLDDINNAAKTLPPAHQREFTASEWFLEQVPHASNRERINFCNKASSIYGFLHDVPAQKEFGSYRYKTQDEIFLQRVKNFVVTHTLKFLPVPGTALLSFGQSRDLETICHRVGGCKTRVTATCDIYKKIVKKCKANEPGFSRGYKRGDFMVTEELVDFVKKYYEYSCNTTSSGGVT